ncbi:uncharacterized protein LOC144824764 [Lissotriton helveticus]
MSELKRGARPARLHPDFPSAPRSTETRDPSALPLINGSMSGGHPTGRLGFPHRNTVFRCRITSGKGRRYVLEDLMKNQKGRLPGDPPVLPAAICRTALNGCRPLVSAQGERREVRPGTTEERRAYLQLSSPIRPVFRPATCRSGLLRSKRLNGAQRHVQLRPDVMQYSHRPVVETLCVCGVVCMSPRSTAELRAWPQFRKSKTELHVYLPNGELPQSYTGDCESLDEGFIEEADAKLSTLSIQDEHQRQ